MQGLLKINNVSSRKALEISVCLKILFFLVHENSAEKQERDFCAHRIGQKQSMSSEIIIVRRAGLAADRVQSLFQVRFFVADSTLMYSIIVLRFAVLERAPLRFNGPALSRVSLPVFFFASRFFSHRKVTQGLFSLA